jgi:hypothetical protein
MVSILFAKSYQASSQRIQIRPLKLCSIAPVTAHAFFQAYKIPSATTQGARFFSQGHRKLPRMLCVTERTMKPT